MSVSSGTRVVDVDHGHALRRHPDRLHGHLLPADRDRLHVDAGVGARRSWPSATTGPGRRSRVEPAGIHHVDAGAVAPSGERDAAAGRPPSDTTSVEDLRAARRRRGPDRAWTCAATRAWRSTESLHRDGDARAARHDDACRPVGLLHAGVGDERDVDDGVVAERVEQHEVLLRAVDGGARGEVPVGCGGRACTARPRRRRRARACATTAAGPPTLSTDDAGLGGGQHVGHRHVHLFARREPHAIGGRGGVTAGHHGDRDLDVGVGRGSRSRASRRRRRRASTCPPRSTTCSTPRRPRAHRRAAACRGAGVRRSTRSSRTTRSAAPRSRRRARRPRRTGSDRAGPAATVRSRLAGPISGRWPARSRSARRRSHPLPPERLVVELGERVGPRRALPASRGRGRRGSTGRAAPGCAATARSRGARSRARRRASPTAATAPRTRCDTSASAVDDEPVGPAERLLTWRSCVTAAGRLPLASRTPRPRRRCRRPSCPASRAGLAR